MIPPSIVLLVTACVLTLLIVLVAGFLAFRAILRTEAYLAELFRREGKEESHDLS